jgi:hypothetical protein
MREKLEQAGDLNPYACRRAAEQRFGVQLMIERYLAMYQQLMERPAAPPVT